MKVNSFLTVSALGVGALAHPFHAPRTIKHIDKRVCGFEERNLFARADATSTATATIPKATAWNPPSGMVTALDQVWTETLKENPGWSDDKNWITDQLIANNGSINYCVRWNHDGTSTAAQRNKTASALQRSLKKWFDVLVGFEGFPLTSLDVNVVGYAVKDKSLLQGDTAGLDIYTTADADGVPECDTRCYRGGHLGVGDDISQCPGGEDSRYDISLWLDDSLLGQMGGYGYNWGEELPPDYFFDTVDNENVHILLHEMGHGFGLLDFYDWVPEGQTSFVMMAGSAFEITEFDAWMLRDWWRKLKAVRGW
ncbi:hypothetical protein D6C93_05273 [Aureobasidium pullulans]|uniref:Cellulose-binding family II protein n=1 Tax=Aureobasidium pullulans TaxID=5580 RepID=A0A4S9RDL1_AURPU|nr:hypothetical protein D6D15_07141 [Aureobasidium pullulans]THY94662.1 hypothetical protein D6C93_05273 [Aureobasidium pullulans]